MSVPSSSQAIPLLWVQTNLSILIHKNNFAAVIIYKNQVM